MKQRLFLLLFAALQLAVIPARADEGMWLLHMLKRINEAEMQQMGLNLSADDIYSLNQACLKDAVITLNGGSCTAELISSQGLVLTNHHCAYGAIQGFSTVEDDILTNGFWAMSLEEEKPIPDFSVTFLQRIEDVTGVHIHFGIEGTYAGGPVQGGPQQINQTLVGPGALISQRPVSHCRQQTDDGQKTERAGIALIHC